jgi:hypothetical protein
MYEGVWQFLGADARKMQGLLQLTAGLSMKYRWDASTPSLDRHNSDAIHQADWLESGRSMGAPGSCFVSGACFCKKNKTEKKTDDGVSPPPP